MLMFRYNIFKTITTMLVVFTISALVMFVWFFLLRSKGEPAGAVTVKFVAGQLLVLGAGVLFAGMACAFATLKFYEKTKVVTTRSTV